METTTRELLKWATAELASAGVASPAADARLLLAEAADLSLSTLVLHDTVTESAAATFRTWVQSRCERRPLQHIIGRAPFLDFDVEVGEGVFIPRPETELLADHVIAVSKRHGFRRALDLCTGSGVLAMALADKAAAEVTAVDIDDTALHFAARNCARWPAITLVHGDVSQLSEIPELHDCTFDVVVCNPPYVPAESAVDVETALYDPPHAVFSGEDGLDLARAILPGLIPFLAPSAFVAMEHDDDNGEQLKDIFLEAGYRACESHYDLAGRPRFITALYTPDGTFSL